MKLCVIVLHYMGLADTLACLDALDASRGAAFDILVVDNASGDGSPDAIRAAHPNARVLSTDDNLGYAGGNNAGIRAALANGAEALFLINNDACVEPDCVARLARALNERPAVGMVGPMVYTFDAGRVISSAGGAIHWRIADASNVGAGETDDGQYPARSVDFVNGCGLMITRAAIERAGLLDERYFMYWEETDWCTRVRRAGFDVRFEPSAMMRHRAPIRSDALSRATLYYMTRNRLRFFATHTPWRIKPLALAHAMHGAWREARRHAGAGRREQAAAMRAGMTDALRRRWGRVEPSAWLGANRIAASMGS